ncbi:unnamed protein product [Allacma fusca]|uniref:Acyltransferase n=1 Tax=Allacma fusca TaxID=39272 RepID=A0A8J2L2V2_9HEXA|nr:unnamed protein product [Allacma fusca]
MTAEELPPIERREDEARRKEHANCANGKLQKGKVVLGVQLAPLRIPWERRMETVAVASFMGTFLLMGPVGFFLFVYLFLCTNYHYLSILYILWYLYDRNRCNVGGRRLDWVRNWNLWKRYCNFFPIQLVKTVELDPKQNYLFASHPHGILCNGAFGNFATEGTSFSRVFPNITPHLLTLEGHYSFPLYREYLMLSGACSASRKSLNFLLSLPEGGHAAVLVPGGPSESLDAHPGKSTKLHLKKRKGFIKIAIQNGVSLVPVYSFGETSIYDQIRNPEGSTVRRIQDRLQKSFGLAPVILKGRGFFQYSFGLLPQRRPITSVVGKPITTEKNANPSQEEIDRIHKCYLDNLVDLFDQHKGLYGYEDEVLEIV